MDDVNATVPGVLQPWGGPWARETLADCRTDQYGNTLPTLKVVCGSFNMPELQGLYCTCDYTLARVGPDCTSATAASRLSMILNASSAVLDMTFLAIVLRKFFYARATGKLRANAGLAVTLLGMLTLSAEFMHSTCRALTMAGVGGGVVHALTRLTAIVTLIAPGMGLILSFSVWTKLARNRLSKASSQKGLDTTLFVASIVFGAFQMASAFSGKTTRAVMASSILMGVLTVIYPVSGSLLIRKLGGTGSGNNGTKTNRSVIRLRNFIAKVTVLTAVNAALLALLTQSMQTAGITTFEIRSTGTVVLIVLKVVYCLMAFVMASFTLDTLLISYGKTSVAAAEDTGAGTNVTTTKLVN